MHILPSGRKIARRKAWKTAKEYFLYSHKFRGERSHIHLAYIGMVLTMAFRTLNLKKEREFVVDSGAPMHMLSTKDLTPAELDTLRVSWNPTIVIAANGSIETIQEATVCVKDLDLFVTVQLLDDAPAVLSVRKLFEDQRYSYKWNEGQTPNPVRHAENTLQIGQQGACCCRSSFIE